MVLYLLLVNVEWKLKVDKWLMYICSERLDDVLYSIVSLQDRSPNPFKQSLLHEVS